MLPVLISFISIIVASAICSMAEAALLSLPMIRARILFEQNKKHSKDLLHIKENIQDTIATIVVLNNAINIAGSIFIGQLVAHQFGDKWLGLVSTIMTLAIIIFSEIIPKTVGERHKVNLSLALAPPVRFIVFILNPILRIILRMAKPFVSNQKLPKVTEDEIKMMLKLARDEGTVEMDEVVLCNRVFKLNDVRAVQIMKPIDQIYALPGGKTLEEVKDAIINSRFSRIAVYNKNPLDIVGIVQHRILLREIAKDNTKNVIKDFMMEPITVNWFTKADALLEKFQAYNQHLFIVRDDKGKTVGLVTMEDVLEELFGEIYDEKDVAKSQAFKGPSDITNTS